MATVREFMALLAADPEVFKVAVYVLLWLPMAGGFFGLALAEIVTGLFPWVVRKVAKRFGWHSFTEV